MPRKIEMWAGFIGIAFLIGCAQAQPRRLSKNQIAATGDALLTAAELAGIGQSETILDALKRTRPSVLVARGGTPVVSIDGSVVGDVSILRTLTVADVCQVRLVRGTSGAGRSVVLPNGHVSAGGDVIAVETRSAAKRCEGDNLDGRLGRGNLAPTNQSSAPLPATVPW